MFNTGVSQPCKRRQVETTGVPRWLLHYIQLRNVWHHRIFCCYKPTSGLHHGGWWHSSPVQCRWEDSEHHDSDFVLWSKNGGRWAGSKMVRGLQKQHRKSFPASTIGTINRVFSYVACFHILQHMWPSSFRFTLYCIFMQKMFPSQWEKATNSGYWSKNTIIICEILIRITEVESMTKKSMMQWGAVNKINYWDVLSQTDTVLTVILKLLTIKLAAQVKNVITWMMKERGTICFVFFFSV